MSLIPRSILFGNPRVALVRISPDGRWISMLAPSDRGVMNVWIRPREGGAPRQITGDRYRGIRAYAWAMNGRQILYIQDQAGDENWHLYATEIDSGRTRDLTPFEGVRAQNLIVEPHRPNHVLIGLNRRDPTIFDMMMIDLRSGEMSEAARNPGDVVGWVADGNLCIRAALTTLGDEPGMGLRLRADASTPWREVVQWPFGEQGQPLAFDAAGATLYALSTLDAPTERLVRLDARSGELVEVLAEHPRSDVADVLVDETTHRVQAVLFDPLLPEWSVLDPAVAGDFQRFEEELPGRRIDVLSRDLDDRFWILSVEADRVPASFHLYDRRAGRIDLLMQSRPDLEAFPLRSTEAHLIEARDGLLLPSYVTRPAAGDDGPSPAVLLVHGGPWARDVWSFQPVVQWLANRGYAVLQVNFRASSGFGKAFMNAGNGQWGTGAMQDDLTDAVRWLIDAGIADPARIGIMGGSYGGYATLAGLAFTPELYACGVDIVGPSNLRTLVESFPPYWKPLIRETLLRMGDVLGDEEFNRRISPLFHVDRIRAPLIIAQGANDPRVNIRESDQMVEALRARGLPVIYVVYPDEGHGLARPENRLDFYGRVDEFLARHLGGEAEPFEEIEGATADLR